MNFQLQTVPQYLTVAELETIVKTRHGDPIDNLVFYKDDPRVASNQLSADDKIPCLKVFYDYYPPLDPFTNRPNAHMVYGTNPLLDMKYTEAYEGETPTGAWKNQTPCEISPPIEAWSKCADHDPWLAAQLAVEAAEKAAAEKAAAEAEAAEKAAIAEAKAKAKAEKLAKKKVKEEAERLAREEEERLAKEAEAERLRKLAEADPEAAARAAAEAAAAEAKAKLDSLPKRAKGGAIGVFLGNTAKSSYGLLELTKESPWKCVSTQVILDEVQKNGKISDMYILKAEVEKYDGEDGEILFCLDKAELYSDNGTIICLKDADKQHFIAHIAAGNGVPPPV